MMRKLFGTDGIRGTANIEPITAETALAVAQAAGLQFQRGDHRHLVVIGKLSRDETPKQRQPGSLAAGLAGIARGVQILRVHDVAETFQALALWRAIEDPG